MIYMEELMLRMYFSTTAMLGNNNYDQKKLFMRYSDIYLVAEEKRDKFYSLAESEEVRAIDSSKRYRRYLRMQEFCKINGIEDETDAEIDEIIKIKGQALTHIESLDIKTDLNASTSTIINMLMDHAEKGTILALVVVGILKAEGIVLGKGLSVGIKNLRKAASWCNVDAICSLLFYDNKNARVYLRQLKNRLKDLNSDIVESFIKAYGETQLGISQEESILLKAFNMGILKPEVFSENHARVLFSKVVPWQDKEKILLFGNKGMIEDVYDLPLGISNMEIIPYSQDAIKTLTLNRKDEQAALISCLLNSDLRGIATYRPLCLSSDCRYVQNQYIKAFSECFRDINIERIELSELSRYDIEPSKNNIFVRSCCEDKPNVFILSFQGVVSDEIFEHAKDFLKSSKRAKFRLIKPSICLDLRDILIICISDRENAKKLAKCCNVKTLAPILPEEKQALVDTMINEKAQLYNMQSISYEESALCELMNISVDKIEQVIDKVILENRKKNDNLLLTEEMIYMCIDGICKDKSLFGFGG